MMGNAEAHDAQRHLRVVVAQVGCPLGAWQRAAGDDATSGAQRRRTLCLAEEAGRCALQPAPPLGTPCAQAQLCASIQLACCWHTHAPHPLNHAQEAEAGDSGGLRNADGMAGTRRAGDAFLGAATKEVFGALAAAGTSVEARINSRKHFRER
jgi:hypothetical protein